MRLNALLKARARGSYTVEASMIMVILMGIVLLIVTVSFELYRDVVNFSEEDINRSVYQVEEVLMIKRLGGELYESVCEECGLYPEDEE